MIFVDSIVWIDYFNGPEARHTDKLDWLLGREPLSAGDLIHVEVLQSSTMNVNSSVSESCCFPLRLSNWRGKEIAIQEARNFRALRSLE